MKKVLVIAGFVASIIFLMTKAPRAAFFDQGLINKSSYTTSNDSLVAISSTNLAGGVLVGIVASTGTGTLSLFDAVGVQRSTISIVSLVGTSPGIFYVPFEVRLSSGLTYTVTGTGVNGVTIIYKITRPN